MNITKIRKGEYHVLHNGKYYELVKNYFSGSNGWNIYVNGKYLFWNSTKAKALLLINRLQK